MTYYGITGERQTHRPRESRLEFRFYFALIFMLTLPFTLMGWVASAILHRRFPETGPVARAWAKAGAIAPMIFLA